jgi:hypothetical protein
LKPNGTGCAGLAADERSEDAVWCQTIGRYARVSWPLMLLLLLLLLLLVIDFLQGIYNCALEAVFVGYIVFAAVQYFQFRARVFLFAALNVLYVYISTFRSLCAVSNMAVFCSALISCSGIF